MEPQDVLPPVTADPSIDQGIAQPNSDQGQMPAPEGDKDYNFRTVVADRDKYRDEVSTLKQQAQEQANLVSMYKNMGYQVQQPQGNQPQQQPQSQPFGGLDFGDAVDSEAFNKIAGAIGQQVDKFTQQSQATSQQLGEMKLALLDKNWRGTIDKYLPDAMKEDPWIMQDLQNAPDAMRSAYHHATHTRQYIQDQTANQQSAEAKRMVDNASKPQSLGSTGPQSNVGTHRDAFDMSDEEFAAAKKRLVSGNYD